MRENFVGERCGGCRDDTARYGLRENEFEAVVFRHDGAGFLSNQHAAEIVPRVKLGFRGDGEHVERTVSNEAEFNRR